MCIDYVEYWNWVNVSASVGIKSPLSPNVPQGLQFEEKVCVQVLPEIVSGERILVWSSW